MNYTVVFTDQPELIGTLILKENEMIVFCEIDDQALLDFKALKQLSEKRKCNCEHPDQCDCAEKTVV